MSSKKDPSYYPVFLDLGGRDCLVVGGGKVAERKALSLLKAGARVRVVSPTLTRRLQKELSLKNITHAARRFRKSDLKGVFLLIAATDSEEENRKIASERDLLVNVVDRPELCSFIVPSTVKRGPLHIAISTSGTSPAMARAIREEVEELYGPKFGAYLKSVKGKRKKAADEIKDGTERERYLKSLGSREIIDELREAKVPGPKRLAKNKKRKGRSPKGGQR